jgi:hypothetical protein
MANPGLKWWHVRWGRFGRGFKKIGLWMAILLASGLILIVAVSYVEGFIGPWLAMRNLSREPSAWVVPKPLSDQSVAQLSGTRIEAYGYSIQTPWNDPAIFEGLRDSITDVSFRKDNVAMLLFNPADKWDPWAIIKSSPEAGPIVSKQALRSNYDLMNAELTATPDQAKWWKMPRENTGILMLVVAKTTHLYEWGNVWRVVGAGVRGFQLGDPAKPPYRVQLHLYDEADRHIRIDIGALGPEGYPLTQAELNAMVASIRPAGKK